MTDPTTARGRLIGQLQSLNLSPDPDSTWAEDAVAAIETEAAAPYIAQIAVLRADFEHMARFRHDEAHNGGIYQGGDFPCDLCPASLQDLPAAAQEWEQQIRAEQRDFAESAEGKAIAINDWLASPDGKAHDERVQRETIDSIIFGTGSISINLEQVIAAHPNLLDLASPDAEQRLAVAVAMVYHHAMASPTEAGPQTQKDARAILAALRDVASQPEGSGDAADAG